MELIMIVHLRVNMNLNDLEMQKMHSSPQKNLINIEYYYNLNMSLVEEVVKPHIMC